jgi:putative FmdB family regulatory protein
MPTYEYKCKVCGLQFEKQQSITAPPAGECPKCRGQVTRLISGGTGFLFKGSSSANFSSNACPYEQGGQTCCGKSEPCGKPSCRDDE